MRSPHIVQEFQLPNGQKVSAANDPMNAVATLAGVGEREVIPQGIEKAVRGFSLHPKANIVTYYDTLPLNNGIENNTLLFFQSKPSQNPTENFFSDNPLPGQYPRTVVGIKIESNLQTIASAIAATTPMGKAGATNNINPIAILNALKESYIRVHADQNEKMVLNSKLSDYFDFENSGVNAVSGTAANPFVIANLKSKGLQRISDPFIIAPNQVFKVILVFKNITQLPSQADWTAAAGGGTAQELKLTVTLHTAEIK